jgi:PAS domain-containing protein
MKDPIADPAEKLVCVGFPMVHGGSAIGVFVLIYPEADEASLSSSVWSMLTIFTQVIAAACSNIQMIARFKRQNRTLETQVQRRTQQLAYSRDVLRVLVDSLPYGVVLLDPEEQIQAANLVFCRQALGLHPRDVVYRPYTEVFQDMTQRLSLTVERSESEANGTTIRSITLIEPSGQVRRYTVTRLQILNIYHEVEQLVEFWREAE